MKRKSKFFLVGGIIGTLITFFLRVIPIKLWNIEHTQQSIWWVSGLMQYPVFHSMLLGALIGFFIGGLIGWLISFIEESPPEEIKYDKIHT